MGMGIRGDWRFLRLYYCTGWEVSMRELHGPSQCCRSADRYG